jgi:CRISPR-associated endoribonuclease Cas6
LFFFKFAIKIFYRKLLQTKGIEMRFRIKFSLKGNWQTLPLNYRYPVSSWIYKVLASADKEFTNILHNHGYKLNDGKTFKLFTFSNLQFPRNTWKLIPKSDRISVWSRNAYLQVSFLLPEQYEKFVSGLFCDQKVRIADEISGIDAEISQIEAMKTVLPETKTQIIRSLTPIVLGITEKDKKHEQYASPLLAEYKELFINNLLQKHEVSGKTLEEKKDIDFKVKELHRNKSGKPKTELQTIKAHTQQQTKIKGWYYDFELTAPDELIKTGLSAGFGSMNSLGFGFCEIINDSKYHK